jgi:hypothetical protein
VVNSSRSAGDTFTQACKYAQNMLSMSQPKQEEDVLEKIEQFSLLFALQLNKAMQNSLTEAMKDEIDIILKLGEQWFTK